MPDTNASFLLREMLKMKRRAMPAARRKRSKPPQIRTQWLYPAGQERKYRKYLTELMQVYSRMATPVVQDNLQRWLDEQKLDDVRADDFNTEFQQLINDLEKTQADMFTEEGKGEEGFSRQTIRNTLIATALGVAIFNDKQWNKMTKRILGDPLVVAEPWLNEVVQAWANNNFALIKGLTGEYVKKLNTVVASGVLEGRTWNAIMGDLRKMNKNVTKARTRLIARDQIGKLNGLLSKRRQAEAGVDMYKWLTARDERVRPTHKLLNNKICRWDDNSVYADTVEDARAGNWKSRSVARMYIGIPGQDIQCRCTAVPVFDEVYDEVDKELAAEQAV